MSFLYDRNQQLFTSRNQVEKKVKRCFLIGLFKANRRKTVCFLVFTMYVGRFQLRLRTCLQVKPPLGCCYSRPKLVSKASVACIFENTVHIQSPRRSWLSGHKSRDIVSDCSQFSWLDYRRRGLGSTGCVDCCPTAATPDGSIKWTELRGPLVSNRKQTSLKGFRVCSVRVWSDHRSNNLRRMNRNILELRLLLGTI